MFKELLQVFGKTPSDQYPGIRQSKQYRKGAFQNQSLTPSLAEGVSYAKVMRYMMNKRKDTAPSSPLPVVKRHIDERQAAFTLTWFGHSSYLIQVQGLNILVDPVFGKRTSFSSRFGPEAFPGTRAYSIHDLPPIDIVLLTHDHYDHLEYDTIQLLKHRVEHWYAPLGVGSHLAFWGITLKRTNELDWWQSITTEKGFILTATPARHFSGRGLVRNKTLWTSYVLQTEQHTIYIGGDSGYDTHFKEIGERFGPFDLAILECGQYDAFWPYIHMMPEQTVQAAIDLKAKILLPVHWGKFALAAHAWNEPIQRLLQAAAEHPSLIVATPMIGEQMTLQEPVPQKEWWVIPAGTTSPDAVQKELMG
jgi:L-ascorbate metabolism protein UlaG (beta-lactamase superfamily)